MSATIDLTRRARIRALAVRMHRSGVAGVFLVGGGSPSVDESALTDNQRAEAAKILKERGAASVDIKDVEIAASVAAIIPRHVKPSCPTCHGEGVMRRGGVDDICACVDRRWQADLDHQAFVNSLYAPGHASGVRVESTRAVDGAKRLAGARALLDRVRVAASAACAGFDSKIETLKEEGAHYFAERSLLDEKRVEAKARAEEQERQADGLARAAEEARKQVDETIISFYNLVAQAFSTRSTAPVDDRATVHGALDKAFAAIASASALCADERRIREAARNARFDERQCGQRIADIDADNAPLIDKIARLCAERTRTAWRFQPKIAAAEKRVRRLVCVTNDAPVNAPGKSQGDTDT